MTGPLEASTVITRKTVAAKNARARLNETMMNDECEKSEFQMKSQVGVLNLQGP
jgi:hypothetical protein